MRKKEVDKAINTQEDIDYLTYRDFLEHKWPGRYELDKTRAGKEYDAFQTNTTTGTNTLIELKWREDYRYNDFPTFLLSLHKLDSMQLHMKEKNAQRGCIVGIYPYDGKVVIFDVTELIPQVADIQWRKVKKTQYDPDSEKVWMPFAVLNLKPGKYKHYSTYVFEYDMENK